MLPEKETVLQNGAAEFVLGSVSVECGGRNARDLPLEGELIDETSIIAET